MRILSARVINEEQHLRGPMGIEVFPLARWCLGSGVIASAHSTPPHLGAGRWASVEKRTRTTNLWSCLRGSFRIGGGGIFGSFAVQDRFEGLKLGLRAAFCRNHTVGAERAVLVEDSPVVDRPIIELRSQNLARIRAALRTPPDDPLLVGALVPLLARDELVRPVVTALTRFGARAAGEMASVLLDPASPDVVRRRLPLALKSCPSPLARDALLASLESPTFELRLRCGRALIALTDEHPRLLVPFPGVLTFVEQEVRGDAEPHLIREHVFNLLALALEREPVRIAARSFATERCLPAGYCSRISGDCPAGARVLGDGPPAGRVGAAASRQARVGRRARRVAPCRHDDDGEP